MTKRITIFGELYSDNLGDGVIAECLAHACKKYDKTADVRHIDMSLHEGYPTHKEAVLDKKPANRYVVVIKRLVGWLAIRKKQASRKWLPILKDTDVLIIGGGQLFLDNQLNFPVKMYVLATLIRQLPCKVICVACGVAKNWSWLGKFFFSRLLKSKWLKSISVRDNQSQINLLSHFNQLQAKVTVTQDPALLAQEAFHISAKQKGNVVGINIMNTVTLQRSVNNLEIFSTQKLERMWIDVIEKLVAKGLQVQLFTNGEAADHTFLEAILQELNPQLISKVIRPTTPEELVNAIGKMDVVVAHRLHANIIAYALEVPTVSLIWDDKVRQFGKYTNRSEYFIEPEAQQAECIVSLVSQALDNTIDREHLHNMKQGIISSLAKQIDGALS